MIIESNQIICKHKAQLLFTVDQHFFHREEKYFCDSLIKNDRSEITQNSLP